MTNSQFHVLRREFLFRIVDRELLSTHAKGDMSKLLLQFVALLSYASIACSIPAMYAGSRSTPQATVLFAWSNEHFLIATTMLVVGLFAILSWNVMFPELLDVLILAPLPIRARTVFLAKVTAVGSALSLTVLSLHAVAGLVWPFALHASAPPGAVALSSTVEAIQGGGGLLGLLRVFAAYWITMFAAGTFVFCLIMGVQGLAANLLPRRYFLRLSTYLQLAAFALIICYYCLQPSTVTPSTLEAARHGSGIWSPSVLVPRPVSTTQRIAISRAAGATRVARPGVDRFRHGGVVHTLVSPSVSENRRGSGDHARRSRPRGLVASFRECDPDGCRAVQSRTLVRSPQHRIILAFYWGVGFAVAIFFLKTPRGQMLSASSGGFPWQGWALLVPNFLILGFAVVSTSDRVLLAARLTSNWIFRITPVQGGRQCVAARRRAMQALSVAPVLALSAAVFLSLWPWSAALGHLVLLALMGMILVELNLPGTQKIPFTCSYLPGRSSFHLTFLICVMLILPVAAAGTVLERYALQGPIAFGAVFALLVCAWGATRWRTTLSVNADAQPQFEEEPSDQLLSLNLWDIRFTHPVTEGVAPGDVVTSLQGQLCSQRSRRVGSARMAAPGVQGYQHGVTKVMCACMRATCS